MAVALERPDILSLAAGFTDNESLPLEDVSSVVDEIAQEGLAGRSALQYGSNIGREGLRELVANRIEDSDTTKRGTLNREQLYISNGSQQALYLAVQTLCDPGDIILVEQPTYFVFLEILQGLGARPIGIPTTSESEIDLAGLESLLVEAERTGELERIKALYLVSYFANPSGSSVSEATKEGIGKILGGLSSTVAIIEDAAYREIYYEKPFSAKSCLALEPYQGAPVFYTSTLTKPYASGLKVGYAYCTEPLWLAAMLNVKGQQDFGTANFAQTIVERAVKKGYLDRHLNSLRSIYHAKMNTLHEALSGPLESLGWNWKAPEGGLYLWLNSPTGLRTDANSPFHEACIKQGVFYVPGDLCYPDSRICDRIRLSFGVLGEEDLREAARRFVAAAMAMTEPARG